jgi:hypothetical protein
MVCAYVYGLIGVLTTPGQDGMRFALVLIKFSVLERPLTYSRLSERRLNRGAISFFASRPGRKS